MAVAPHGVGEALRVLRSIYGLPQDRVAKAAGISRQLLTAYEGGRLTPTSTRAGELLRVIATGVADASA